jgi:O-acetyl-ADP-ribose deacetylase (regulator of RNase III)|tara:strand:- start:4462 stop:5016 length:555 start_codon:yes stop_codon:yes gene_type:complete
MEILHAKIKVIYTLIDNMVNPEAITANIVSLNVDAIVNAANSSLLGGGGVDGAIHRAAGPELLSECRQLNGCSTGQAKVTLGYRLPARYIIHTVGPVWHGGDLGEDRLLASCYRTCMAEAASLALKSIAFPAISTGVYGYPLALATRIAVDTIMNQLEHTKIQVMFVCFDDEVRAVYEEVLSPG